MKKSSLTIYIFGFLLFIPYLIIVVKANSDLTMSYALFMDELISFKGVEKIFHSTSLSEFFNNVTDGRDHRYGRIFWNISAFTSFLPYHIWGEAGQIIATRMTHSLLMFSAYILLAWTFLKDAIWRVTALLILLLLPSTPYYAHMPKPEPIQLFFLALFFWVTKKKGLLIAYGWLLLGIAFGAKISLLPFILYMILLLGFILFKEDKPIGKRFLIFVQNISALLIGLGISVPILFWGKVGEYLKRTIYNTGHSNDDQKVGLFSWLDFLLDKYFAMPAPLTLFLGITVLFSILYHCRDCLKLRNVHNELRRADLLLIFAGFSFLLPVMLFTKRLWGFYLHNGLVLLIIASLFCLYEYQAQRGFFYKLFASGTLALLLISYVFFQGKSTSESYSQYAGRTITEKFRIKEKERTAIMQFLDTRAKTLGKPLKVLINPWFYSINTTERYSTKQFWQKIYWHSGADYIINYGNKEPEHLLNIVSKTSILHQYQTKELESKQKHLLPTCQSEPCYMLIPFTLKHIRIYEKQSPLTHN